MPGIEGKCVSQATRSLTSDMLLSEGRHHHYTGLFTPRELSLNCGFHVKKKKPNVAVSVYSGCRDTTPSLGAYKQEKCLSYSSQGWGSGIRVPAWLSLSLNLLPDCRLPASCCILTWLRAEGGAKLSPDWYKGANSIHQGSTLMTSSNPKLPLKDPTS